MTAHSKCPVVIVGGGPVGLYLALKLLKSGVKCRVLEKRMNTDPHSRSIGIHPVSLELFEELGITEKFLERGVKIKTGQARTGDRRIGILTFQSCPPPFNFVLSLPQFQTESLLEEELNRIDPGCLVRGAEVTGIQEREDRLTVRYHRNGETNRIDCRWLAGCDGKNSMVRRSAGIEFRGKPYRDTYLMGDFEDNTSFGTEAVIYLHPDGLVESFPLPGNLRRWVVKTKTLQKDAGREAVERLLHERIHVDVSRTENRMVSSFGVQKFIAATLFQNRILLAGDSAHVVSPIGGQGMNLGWLTAHDLAQTICNVIAEPEKEEVLLRTFSSAGRKRAVQAARRAALNMWLGRERTFPLFRNLLAHAIVNTPMSRLAANVFTMRGLGRWPV